MDTVLTEFAEILRQNGLKVSTAEVQDAARAVALLGLEDRETLRSTLAATLVKRDSDQAPFERAFTLYFSGATRMLEAIDRSLAEQIDAEGLLTGDDLTMLVAWLPRVLAERSSLFQALVQGDRGTLSQLLRGAMLQLELTHLQSALQTSFYARRLGVAAGVEKARADAQSLGAELAKRGLSNAGVEVVSRHLAARLRLLEETARSDLQRQAGARGRRTGGLSDRSFQTLSPAEVQLAQDAVRKLAHKLKARWTRTLLRKRRGVLHVRRTLRKNMSWGAIPMLPQLRGRRRQRPDLVVLCDVSDSVRNASRMMLLFMYSLQALFSRVRSFVFVSDLGEITESLKDANPEEAVDLALAGRSVSLQANSNYGRVLASFVGGHLGSITQRTTVMVIGDGRNNYNPSNAWALEEIRRRARRLVWICSEPRSSWGLGDSEMLNYERWCHQVEVVQTLDDLSRLGDVLAPE